MQKITKEYEVFNFSELTDEVKQEVIDKYYEHEDYPFLEQDIEEELYQIDEHKIFKDVKLEYSLSYCQGDGLSFSADIDLKSFLDNIYSVKLPQYKKDTILNYVYKVQSNGNSGHYAYCHKEQIEFDYNYDGQYTYKRIDKLWDNILEEIKEYYVSVCKKLEKYGYSVIEYRMNFVDFADYSDSNEIKYLENGKIFRE